MKIVAYPYESLGHENHGWLDARHHFSFAGYHNPDRVRFGLLRVINDDTVAAGAGFDTHPHQDMEIITYVRQGAITHEDSLGNKGVTTAGDVQVMSAGSGVAHSEYNREDVDTRLYQIWIFPNKRDVEPRWEAKQFPKTPVSDQLNVLVSGYDDDVSRGALFIHQFAAIYGGRMSAGSTIKQPLRHQAYVLVSEGEVEIGDTPLKAGDGAEITGCEALEIYASVDAEVLVIDVPDRPLA